MTENKELENKAKETLEARKDEPASEDTGKGSKPEATGLIDKGSAVAERLEKQLDREEALQARKEEFAAKQLLAGTADAGAAPKSQEETDQEEADRRVGEFR